MNFEFEKEIVELENKIVEMKKFSEEKGIDLSGEISKFVAERDKKLKEIYKNLSSWDKVFVSRHPERPYTLDYIENIATCLLYTSPSPRDGLLSRMPSSA